MRQRRSWCAISFGFAWFAWLTDNCSYLQRACVLAGSLADDDPTALVIQRPYDSAQQLWLAQCRSYLEITTWLLTCLQESEQHVCCHLREANHQTSSRWNKSIADLLITSGVPKKTTLGRVSGGVSCAEAVQMVRVDLGDWMQHLPSCCRVCQSRRLVKAGGAQQEVKCDRLGKHGKVELFCQMPAAKGLKGVLPMRCAISVSAVRCLRLKCTGARLRISNVAAGTWPLLSTISILHLCYQEVPPWLDLPKWHVQLLPHATKLSFTCSTVAACFAGLNSDPMRDRYQATGLDQDGVGRVLDAYI